MEIQPGTVPKGLGAWDVLPGRQTIEKTLDSLKSRGFRPELVPNRQAALERVRELIPDGARVMTGASRTLEEIGFAELLASGNHGWVNLKGPIIAEKDREKQTALRKQAILADYFLGSVHAITTAGQLVVGSASGSQLAAYAYGARNLVLVAGTQKIAADLDQALRRLREYSTPLEDKRMKGLGFPGTYLSKTLIIERETQRNIHIILVDETLGF